MTASVLHRRRDRERRRRRSAAARSSRAAARRHDGAVDRVVDAHLGAAGSSSSRPVRSINVEQRGAPCRRAPTPTTSPARTAAASFSPKNCGGPGISRSSPAFAAGTVLCVPNQSDITRPSKPHSSRRIAMSSACSLQYGPLTRLYAVINAHVPASVTAASNGTSEISRSVRSSTSELIVMRSNSESLATKCFTVHADALRLHAGDVRDGHARRQERVLGVALEVAARERMAMDVDGRREQRVRLLAPRLDAEPLARPRARARGSRSRRARCRTGSSPTAGPTTARRARRSARR